MFDQIKSDPSQLEELKGKDEDTIVVSDYVYYDKDQVLKTEVQYVTKKYQLRGILSLYPEYM